MQLSRNSSGINCFYIRSNILFAQRFESELSTFYRNSTLKNALSSQRVNCQHFPVKVNVSTWFSRSKVEFLLLKVNCQRAPWYDYFSSIVVERKLASGIVAGTDCQQFLLWMKIVSPHRHSSIW